MNAVIGSGIIVIVIGISRLVALRERPRESSGMGIASGSVLILLGAFAVAIASAAGGVKDTGTLYKAAHKQNITISVSAWKQIPATTEPCHVELDFDRDEGQLLIVGTETVATPEVLKVLCAR